MFNRKNLKDCPLCQSENRLYIQMTIVKDLKLDNNLKIIYPNRIDPKDVYDIKREEKYLLCCGHCCNTSNDNSVLEELFKKIKYR